MCSFSGPARPASTSWAPCDGSIPTSRSSSSSASSPAWSARTTRAFRPRRCCARRRCSQRRASRPVPPRPSRVSSTRRASTGGETRSRTGATTRGTPAGSPSNARSSCVAWPTCGGRGSSPSASTRSSTARSSSPQVRPLPCHRSRDSLTSTSGRAATRFGQGRCLRASSSSAAGRSGWSSPSSSTGWGPE